MSETPLHLAMAWIIRTEGGYVNDPDDAGGETKFGISKRQYPEIDIPGLTIEQAQEIYRRDYWDAYRCNDLPGPTALITFDGLVQHRPKPAALILQQAIGAKADGIIGPKTVALARAANPHTVVRLMALGRLDLYDAIIRANSKNAKFANGWRGRILDLYEFIITEFTLD